ncbi:MAG: hypothetical protein AAGH73_01440 [Pseudomonadota bacterium]
MTALKIAAMATALALPGAVSAQEIDMRACTAAGGTLDLAAGTCTLASTTSTAGPITLGAATAAGSSPALIALGVALGFIVIAAGDGT